MSVRAYARHRGVSHKAVQKAIEARRITTTPDGKIDPAKADVEWQRNTAPRPLVPPRRERGKEGKAETTRSRPTTSLPSTGLGTGGTSRRVPSPPERREPSAPTDAPGGTSYATARAVKERFLAGLAKIEYEKQMGKLISRDEVQVERFNTGRIVRDAVLNIADRVAAQLAAETEEKKVHEILTTELRNALHGIADALTS